MGLNHMQTIPCQYGQLMAKAMQMLPAAVPAWTEYNASDPGITLIEVLAWLTEIQAFRLDRVPALHYHQFLSLIGQKPRPGGPAKAFLQIKPGTQFRVTSRYHFRLAKGLPRKGIQLKMRPAMLPAGTPLTVGESRFETLNGLPVCGIRLLCVFSAIQGRTRDLTRLNHPSGPGYWPLGERPSGGDCLYLGLEGHLPKGQWVSLCVQTSACTPAHNPNAATTHTHDGQLAWEFPGSGETWQPLKLALDTTRQFSTSGRICFKVPAAWQKTAIPGDVPSCYFLRVRVVRHGFDSPPKWRGIFTDVTQAVAQHTHATMVALRSGGRRSLCVLAAHLFLNGRFAVQLRNRKGLWEDWPLIRPGQMRSPRDKVAIAAVHKHAALLKLRFPGATPPGGKHADLRLTATARSSAGYPGILLGQASGVAGQQFALGRAGEIAQITLQERVRGGWQDWVRVDHFFGSLPTDRHFVADGKNGKLYLGDGKRGYLPPPAPETHPGGIGAFRLINLVFRNTHAQPPAKAQWWSRPKGARRLQIACPADWYLPGKPAEDVVAATMRLHQTLDTPTRAVTPGDVAAIAKNTPNLAVTRVHVTPNPPLPAAPKFTAFLVSAVPQNLPRGIPPSRRFLGLLAQHLEEHRLLGTRITVIAPVFVMVEIHLQLVIVPGVPVGEVQKAVHRCLLQYLHPTRYGPQGQGWPFGMAVRGETIRQMLLALNGVSRINALRISTGRGAVSGGGDLHLHPFGLADTREELIHLQLSEAGT